MWPVASGDKVTYSQFIARVNAGTVDSVSIDKGTGTIHGTSTDGSKFTAIGLSLKTTSSSRTARLRGRHTGDLLGHPATGREFAYTGMAMYRIANGQLAEAWYAEDTFGWFQQLGLIAARDMRVPESVGALSGPDDHGP